MLSPSSADCVFMQETKKCIPLDDPSLLSRAGRWAGALVLPLLRQPLLDTPLAVLQSLLAEASASGRLMLSMRCISIDRSLRTSMVAAQVGSTVDLST